MNTLKPELGSGMRYPDPLSTTIYIHLYIKPYVWFYVAISPHSYKYGRYYESWTQNDNFSPLVISCWPFMTLHTRFQIIWASGWRFYVIWWRFYSKNGDLGDVAFCWVLHPQNSEWYGLVLHRSQHRHHKVHYWIDIMYECNCFFYI